MSLDMEELVPLHTGFDQAWRGYDRAQVDDYVQGLERELVDLAADRDASAERADHLARQLDDLRVQNGALRKGIEQACRAPLDPDKLPRHLAQMVELANAEADEVIRRAEVMADRTWAASARAAARLCDHYERLAAETQRVRDEVEIDHRDLILDTQTRAAAILTEAQVRQQELDEEAARSRRMVEEDFELAMVSRRREAMRALTPQQIAC